MLTLTYKDIRNPDFPTAMRKVASCPDFKTPALLTRAVKAYKAIVENETACVEVIKKLQLQHGQQQEDGSTKIVNHEGFTKDMEELLKTEFTIDIEAFKFNDLLPAKLSAIDINALGVLVSL